MSVIPHPDDPGTEIAIGHRRYRLRVADPVYRRYPEIEHAIKRRPKRYSGAIRANPHDASLGISKNQAAR